MPKILSYLKAKVTFSPRRRNRLRQNGGAVGPNGKGIILGKKAANSRRKELIKDQLRILGPLFQYDPGPSQRGQVSQKPTLIRQQQRKLREAIIDEEGDVRCPHCGRYNYKSQRRIEPGEIRCARTECGEMFLVKKKELKRARINSCNNVKCPHCEECAYDAMPGPMQCLHCGDLFEAYSD